MNLHEASEVSRAMYGPSAVHPVRGSRGFVWHFDTYVLGPIRLTRGRFPMGATFSTQQVGDVCIFSFPRAGFISVAFDHTTVNLSPDRVGVLISPGQSGRSSFSADAEPVTIAIDHAALGAHLSKITQRSTDDSLLFDPHVNLAEGPGASLLRLFSSILDECARLDGLLDSAPLRASLADTLLTALLTAAQHNHTHRLSEPARLIAPASVRRAEEWIDAHASEAVRMSDVAAASGVSLRALQSSFQRFRGQSPMHFLKDRRLDLARQQLTAATPGVTVASVAAGAGYRHPGRFAVEYRQRFGESPSDTLRGTTHPAR